MQVLVIGNGGREHALAWKLAASPRVSRVYVAPGNVGTATEPGCENVAIEATDTDGLLAFARAQGIALTVVGPEAPLVAGLVDAFTQAGLICLGPRAAAAELEGSKDFAKRFMQRHGVPTARYATFEALDAARTHLEGHPLPVVIKADGLAAGKGVVIAESLAEAQAAVTDMLEGNAYGAAGARVVIEEFLEGEEASFIFLTDGTTVRAMASSQDHKRVGEGDVGPNTGGMGAYSPAPVVDAAVRARVESEVVQRVLAGLAADDLPYRGFLYAGLMIASDGSVRVLEFNCRFGDPECQPVLMRLRSDFAEACLAAAEGRLDEVELDWDPRPAVGVVATVSGYPGDYPKGMPIRGLAAPSAEADPDTRIFEAGTAFGEDGQTRVTSGGRVLCATALGETIAEARTRAYALLESVDFDGINYRRDIAYRALRDAS